MYIRDDHLGYRETRNAIALIVCSSVREWPVPGVECRLVRRNTIPWTFLAYIAAHYMIESKRTTGTDGATGNNGSRRGTQSRRPRRFHQVYASSSVLFVDFSDSFSISSESFFLSFFLWGRERERER